MKNSEYDLITAVLPPLEHVKLGNTLFQILGDRKYCSEELGWILISLSANLSRVQLLSIFISTSFSGLIF